MFLVVPGAVSLEIPDSQLAINVLRDLHSNRVQ